MKYSLTTSLAMVLVVLHLNGKAQNVANSSIEARNDINLYVGLFDANINYERTIRQRPKSHSNIRFGFGYAGLLNDGEGKYINPAFVHLMGKRDSHMEIDVGIKYMLTNSISDPNFSDTFIPDIFVGYRYEQPSGGFIFRIGFSYPTVINLGIGYKF
jgi:hypothetical protein